MASLTGKVALVTGASRGVALGLGEAARHSVLSRYEQLRPYLAA